MKWSTLSDSEQWLLRVSGTLFIAATLVWSGVAFMPYMSKPRPKVRTGGVVWAVPRAERVEARRSDAIRLREKMKVWAEKNKNAIRDMRSGDEKAFQEVYVSIPAHPNENIIGMSSQDVHEFSWECHAVEAYPLADTKLGPETRSRLRSSVTLEQALLEHNRKNSRDIAVIRSILPGRKDYILWASGRVTETTSVENCRDIIDCSIKEKHTEIAPPYDFVD